METEEGKIATKLSLKVKYYFECQPNKVADKYSTLASHIKNEESMEKQGVLEGVINFYINVEMNFVPAFFFFFNYIS